METQKLKDCIKLCQMAYEELEIAKSDCNAKVEAALETFVAGSKAAITKDDKAAIKNTAQHQAKETIEDLAAKLASQIDILEASGAINDGEIADYGFAARNRKALDAAAQQMGLFN